MKKGDKIYFEEEKRPYTVRVAGKRYLICTKPYNIKHTVLYTIVDLVGKVRGAENLIFGLGAETDSQCFEMFMRIDSGETELSIRNRIPLRIKQ